MKYYKSIGNIACFGGFNVLIRSLLLLLLLAESLVTRANIPKDEKDEKALVYEEIPVRVMVEGYKTFYLDALYTNKKLLYVDIADLFTTLNISCQTGKNANTLTGFIEKETQTYLIDFEKKVIKVGNSAVQSSTGLVKNKGILYMESTLFDQSFGITLNFNYRALSIQVRSNFELPLIKQLRIEKIRNNLSKIKGELPADTLLQRKYHLMKFGTLDWSVASTQSENASKRNYLKLAIGTEFLYGEADVTVNYYDQQKFDNRQLYYLWRWVDNNKPFIKQAQIGTISPQSISFINAPVIGATIRNAPTTLRKAAGYYYINEYTEPNRDVELYINNILIDYTKADASGLYLFKVPIIYGYNTLKLKFYGPMGEEKTVERTMNVPYTVMPTKEFEYGLSAGIVEDSSKSRFARVDLNYGVNRYLTIGGGVEYLSSIVNGSKIPFLMATFQPISKLTLNAEYAHGVKTKGQMNYYFKKDIYLEIDYTKYVEGQHATIMNALEERKARLSAPFSFKKMRGFVRFDYTQLVYNTFKYNQTNLMFSAYYKLLSANSSTQINWINRRSPYIISDLALYYRPGRGLTLSPSAQYDACNKTMLSYKVTLEKYIAKGDFSISYERKVSTNTTILNVNFKYDLKFARTGISVSRQKAGNTNSEDPFRESTVISESAQGSLAFGRGNKQICKSNNSSVGRGGISFYPFLDLNQNGKFDQGESMVKLSPARFMGNKITTEKDSILSFSDLTPFTWFTIEFKDKDLENISWRFRKNRYRVLIDPNQFKRVDVPVVPISEITGMAYLIKEIKLPEPAIPKIASLPEQTTVHYVLKSFDIAQLFDHTDNKISMVTRDTMIYLKRTMLYDVQLYTSHKPIKPGDLFTQLIAKVPGIKIMEMAGKDGLYHYSTGVFLNPDEAYTYFQYIREKGWLFGYVTIYSGGKRKVINFK